MKTLFLLLLPFTLPVILLLNLCQAAERQGEQTMKMLPEPRKESNISLETCIAKRRSVRSFSKEELTDKEIGQLLWAAQGITDKRHGFRAVPSAGARYPLETYVVTQKGIFHYLPHSHTLEKKKKGDFRASLAKAALSQLWIREAPAIVVFTAYTERTTSRYGARGTMYIHMEAGHAAQNIHLQAVALGLCSVPVGAFNENMAATLIGVEKGECVLYLIPVGKPRR